MKKGHYCSPRKWVIISFFPNVTREGLFRIMLENNFEAPDREVIVPLFLLC